MRPVIDWQMQVSPSTHFVAFSQPVLHRGAGLGIVWPDLLAGVEMVFFTGAALRLRRTLGLTEV